jgi:hypothetical protein
MVTDESEPFSPTKFLGQNLSCEHVLAIFAEEGEACAGSRWVDS